MFGQADLQERGFGSQDVPSRCLTRAAGGYECDEFRTLGDCRRQAVTLALKYVDRDLWICDEAERTEQPFANLILGIH